MANTMEKTLAMTMTLANTIAMTLAKTSTMARVRQMRREAAGEVQGGAPRSCALYNHCTMYIVLQSWS